MRKDFLIAALLVILLTPNLVFALDVTAAGGSAADIQVAVDQVAAAGEGIVYIPEGDFACDIDTSLGPNPPPFNRPYAVLIPGGVSIIGQGIGKTILRQTIEPVNLGNMFIVDGRNGLRTRISGITFIGAPFTVEGEPYGTNGIYMHGATDFRIDHCYFENWNSKAISCSNTYEHAWGDNRGVIDHCIFDNPYKDNPDVVGAGTGGRKIWGYGMIPGGKGVAKSTDYYLGKYDGLEDIVYIEDCNFSRTRHAIASNSYGWYVVRNSKFYEPRPEHYGIIDVHGFNFGRGLEAYNNEIYGCEYQWNGTDEVPTGRWLSIGFSIRGGGGVIFNNSLIDINKGIQLSDESPESGEGRIDDLWIWSNPMITQDAPSGYAGDDGTYILPAEFVEGVEYHLDERLGYTPYPYPHPLTIEPSNKHRFWGRLLDANNLPVQSEISALMEGTDIVITSNQTDANGDYGLEIQPGTYDIRYRILNPSFYVPNFFLRLHSINMSMSLRNVLRSITPYPTEKKIGFILNVSARQRIQTYSHMTPARVRINGTLLSEVTDISDLKDNTWYYDETGQRLHMIVSPLVSVMAASGSAADIQAAVDQVVAAGGIGDVHIPEGTFNFVEVGETLITVEIPAGINIYGAPTARTSGISIPEYGMNPNDQVIEWKTVLVIPAFECAPNALGEIWGNWFQITGDSDPDKSTRISDIKFAGYKTGPDSPQMTRAIEANDVMNLRVDHCHFENLGAHAVRLNGVFHSGVIDHCRIENPAGGETGPWGEHTIQYGISSGRDSWYYGQTFEWDPDISKILGKYTNFSLYIEDCYFSQWRHSITSNHGAHWAARHNTFNWDKGYGTVDCHGPNKDTEPGTRATEVYYNAFLNKSTPWDFTPSVMFWTGGGGIFWHNYERTYDERSPYGARLIMLAVRRFGADTSTYPQDVYVWDNDITCSEVCHVEGSSNEYIREGIEFHLRPPSMGEDGFEYTPYPYPHPFTLEN